MKKLSQKGFTLVEGLLVVIALGIVIAIGFYIYSASKASPETVTNKAPESSVKAADNKSSSDYLVVKEFGFKLDKTALPSTYYKIVESEAKRSYPQVPELKVFQLFDSNFDATKNSQGVTCGTGDSAIITVQVMSVADRDSRYASYKNATLGPNDNVPTVVSDRYAKQVGDYLYDYYKTQGVQGLISCADDPDKDASVIDKYNSSYEKLKQIVSKTEQA